MALFDLVKVQVIGTPGQGPIELGDAKEGFRSFAVVPDGSSVSYGILDVSGRETGVGVYNATAGTLQRTLRASSTGALLDLTEQAVVFITPTAQDFPTAAAIADIYAGASAAKFITPKAMADALATVTIDRTAAAVGVDFSTFINVQIVLDANGTLGPPSGGYPGQSGVINVANLSGTATLAYNAAYRMPKGGITIEAGVNAATRIPYMIGGAGAVILFPASKWA